MIDIGYFAAGIIAAWAMWTATGFIRSDFIRTTLRAITTAVSVTPAIVVGHGVGVLPAYLLLFEEKYTWWGVIPIVAVTIILLVVFFSVQKVRESRYKDKISWRDIFLHPPEFKLFLMGLIIVLLKAEFREVFHDHWILQLFLFMAITGLHPFLCYTAQQAGPRSSVWLPVWFVIPVAINYYPVAILYYFSGLAGSFAGRRNFYYAYLAGVIGAGLASLNFGWRLYIAIKYADVQYVTIQGGITGSAIFLAFVLILFIFCLAGFRKHYITKKLSKT